MLQISAYEYKQSMRFLLCLDVISHRIPTGLDIETQRTSLTYVENQLAVNRQTNDLWIKDHLLK